MKYGKRASRRSRKRNKSFCCKQKLRIIIMYTYVRVFNSRIILYPQSLLTRPKGWTAGNFLCDFTVYNWTYRRRAHVCLWKRYLNIIETAWYIIIIKSARTDATVIVNTMTRGVCVFSQKELGAIVHVSSIIDRYNADSRYLRAAPVVAKTILIFDAHALHTVISPSTTRDTRFVFNIQVLRLAAWRIARFSHQLYWVKKDVVHVRFTSYNSDFIKMLIRYGNSVIQWYEKVYVSKLIIINRMNSELINVHIFLIILIHILIHIYVYTLGTPIKEYKFNNFFRRVAWLGGDKIDLIQFVHALIGKTKTSPLRNTILRTFLHMVRKNSENIIRADRRQ